MGKKELHPVHPGEVLLEEFLRPMGLSQNRLALDIGVPPRRINEIVLGKRSITADTALRLARYFGTSQQSGFVYRFGMIWKLQNGSWANASTGKSKFVNNRMFAPDGNGK